jgi:hypothetical protein
MGYMLHAIRDRVALDVAQARYDAMLPPEGDEATDEALELLDDVTTVEAIMREARSALLRDDIARFSVLAAEAIITLKGKL